MQAGAGALADREQALERGPALEVAVHSTDQVVGGGRDGHRLALGRQPRVPAGGEHVREPLAVEVAQVEQHVVRAVGVHPVEDRDRHLVAGGELVGEPLARGVEQPRTFAADRLGDQRTVMAGAGQRQRGGVELTQLEVGELGAGLVGEHRSGADRSPGIRRPPPQRRPAAGGQHGRPGCDRAAVGDHPCAALPVAPQCGRRGGLDDVDRALFGDQLGQPRGDRAPRLAAAGVHDPPRRMPALQPERQFAAGIAVEAHPARSQLLNGGGCLAGQDLDRARPAQPAPGGERVRRVALGGVVGGQRRSQSALRPEARALRERLA